MVRPVNNIIFWFLFIGFLLLLIVPPASGSANGTKIAYTRDGVHFISKERVEENIRYEYARQGEYREVSVPLDTVVVGASVIPENLSAREIEVKSPDEEKTPVTSNQSEPRSEPEGKYPYATISIGVLLIGGLVFFAVSHFSGRYRQ
jgi:hypothetical protein